MNLAAIFHQSTDNFCYPLDTDRLVINLLTDYDVERVFLHWSDPFDSDHFDRPWSWCGKREEIVVQKHLPHHRWWSAVVEPRYKRCAYFFELHANGEIYYYLEDGFHKEENFSFSGTPLLFFIFAWMNRADIAYTPEWVQDTIWYQIFPERFCNGDPTRNPEGVRPWQKGPVRNSEFYGGDLRGIIKKLDYLQKLGVTGLYFTPIFASTTSHKYNTTDYLRIDPAFGDEATLRELVETAHQKGIRIMLDGVFNHCGHEFPQWQDVLQHGPQSPYFDWFMVNQWPFDATDHSTKDGKFYSFAYAAFMPKLNTNNPAVIDYLVGICEYWVRNFGIDGLRLDVADEVSHQFCRTLRQRMKQLNPDLYILGEIWHNSMPWLRGDEFDSVMNYPLKNAIAQFWLDKSQTAIDFEHAVNACYTTYPQQINRVLFNLLDSHDTDRLITRTGSLDVFYQQLAVLYTMPGCPCVYYGTEIALEGGPDPDCRRCMPWDDIEAGLYDDRIELLHTLMHLRKTEPLFKAETLCFPDEPSSGRVITYYKKASEAQLEIILNAEQESISIDGSGTVLFARLLENGKLASGGVLIRKQTISA